MRRLACLALGVAALVAPRIRAGPLATSDVPEPLAPWVDWVLRGHEEQRCPFLEGGERRACLWPSLLELELDDRSGSFAQHWQVHREAQVPLPGDARRWPEDVRADGKPIAVIATGERPSVRLAPGSHELRGRFRWDALPELLQIPPETGLVRLRLRGRDVPAPDRDAEGRLWLARLDDAPGEAAEQALEVSVHRRISDEVPLLLETRVQLRVSGRSREVVLGRALPAGFEPLALSAALPLRLDPDGRLRAQLRAGSWDLVLLARHLGPAQAIALDDPGGTWDASEEWVFEAHPALRVASVEGVPAIDPSQAGLPAEWHALPAYLVQPGQTLRLVEKQRGDADPAPDQLALERVLWLDFDGRAATASDTISGTVRRSSRLEMQAGTELGRAALGGSDQLITRLEGAEQIGIEVPPGAIQLAADSRVPAHGALLTRRLPAVGWDADVQSLHALLQLPPGWRLLHASGVDRADSTWFSDWTLLDLFAVWVLSLAFARLWGARWGGLALLGLALVWTEPAAPHWAWAAVLAGEALSRALPAGRVPRLARAVVLYRAAALGVLVLIAIPFAVRQIRSGIFPALEQPWRAVASREPPAAPAPELGLALDKVVAERSAKVALQAARMEMSQATEPYAPDPRASVTTGPGLPAWSWTQVELAWSGPVQREQVLSLVVLPPLANGALAFARAGLLAALLFCLLGIPAGRARSWLRAAAALWLLVLPVPARADLPTPELLEELRRRLLEAPDCHPHCAEITRLALELEPRALRARLEVQAQAETAIALPGGTRGIALERVLVDGKPAGGLLRAPDGTLWAQVGPGRSELIAEGVLPERDSLELALPARPRRVEVRARGWTVHGVHEDGVPEASLQLERIREGAAQAASELESGELPPFVRVERYLQLGLEWQARTQVVRLSPADAPLSLAIALLPEESITSAGVRAENGRALVAMAPGTTTLAWTSVLAQQPELVLRAATESASSEVWRLDASPVWHIEASGIPPLHQPDSRTREWRPWPGEQVRLAVLRPTGIEGGTATLDAAVLALAPALRATDASLQLGLRSSRGGQHVLTLPEGAELLHVEVDGSEQPVRQQERTVTLPVRPGAQSIQLAWREPRGARTPRYVGSEVDLGLPVVNAELHIAPSPARWTLFASGPRLGPSVLFWPLLLVLAGIAWALARVSAATGLTPLRLRHWLGLGIGLTQVPIAAAALVALWLVALGWRGQRGTRVPGAWFDLLQLALAGLTALALAVLFFAIERGLLGAPDMQIAGNGSSAELLRWYQDRSSSVLPRPALLSVPLWVYRAAMLAWSLWLAYALVGWLRWGWSCYSSGELWRPLRRRVAERGA
jgi:hypothetical protein